MPLAVSRRTFLATAAAAVSMPAAARASDMDFTPEVILDNLAKAVWLSTNRTAPRKSYVIAAPWCPYTRQLYDAIQTLAPDVDFRFVFMDHRGFGPALLNAYVSNVPDQVGLFYADPGRRNPNLPMEGGIYMDSVNIVTGYKMARGYRGLLSGTGGSGNAAGFTYPTVIQRETDGRITGTLGAWLSLSGLAARTATQDQAGPDARRYFEFLTTAPGLRRHRRNTFAARDGVLGYAAQLGDAPVVDRFRQGHGRPTIGTLVFGGEEWVAAEAFRNAGHILWMRAAETYSR